MTVATFVAIAKQSRGSMAGAMGYVAKDEKTLWKGISLVAGHNCVPQSSYIEFLTTKKRFHKMEGRQFYHFVQSFAEGDRLSPQMANAIGVELAEQEFPDFEVLVATHIDTGHLHNHLIVNSVSCVDGRKLHQNTADLQHHRDMNDQICLAHGLSVLPKSRKHSRKKRMEPGEYGHMEGDNTPIGYCQIALENGKKMLEVSPSLSLCSSGPYPNKEWVELSAKPLGGIS